MWWIILLGFFILFIHSTHMNNQISTNQTEQQINDGKWNI